MFRLAALYVIERLREQLLAHISDMLRAACAAKVRHAAARSWRPQLAPAWPAAADVLLVMTGVPLATPQERQSRRGEGRHPSRAEQRLRSLFDAGNAQPELGVEVS
jgi:hypothetical protein